MPKTSNNSSFEKRCLKTQISKQIITMSWVKTRKKVVKILKSLSEEEKKELLKMLKDEYSSNPNPNFAKSKFPQDATQYEYQGDWKDIYY